MRTCVIFNPAARGQKAQKLGQLLQAVAHDCQCKPTSAAGDARIIATQAVHDGFDTVIAAGGDGTLNEVVNGIGNVRGGFAKVRLGVLPLGTVNVFARELRIPLDLKRAWKTILQGKEMTIDLPKAEFQRHGKPVSQYFAQLGGAGLDSNAVALVNWELKKKIRSLAYIAAGLKAMWSPQPKITVKSATNSITGELILIGNGKFYGGNFVLFPKAKLDDGLLDVCIFRRANWLTLFQASAGLLTGNLHRVCDTKELRASAFTLTADQPTFLQLDGENVGELPATFSVESRMLRVIVP